MAGGTSRFPGRRSPFDGALGEGRAVTASRREARRQALVLLFQWDVTGQPLGSTFEGEADPWARELAEGVTARADQLDAVITAASDEWSADRLGAVERNVLRIAIHELDRGAVPVEVAIDEAVHLAKRFGAGDDAARLVNGILGRILRERVA
jgi:N utilization substance protein B